MPRKERLVSLTKKIKTLESGAPTFKIERLGADSVEHAYAKIASTTKIPFHRFGGNENVIEVVLSPRSSSRKESLTLLGCIIFWYTEHLAFACECDNRKDKRVREGSTKNNQCVACPVGC